MRSRYLSATFFLVTISAVILGLRAIGFTPATTVPLTNSPAEKVAPVERVAVQGDAGGLRSMQTAPAATRVNQKQDGLALLESHCTQCHKPQWILQIERPRTGWEKTLEQMEAMGVHLEDSEKAILLDYLASAGES